MSKYPSVTQVLQPFQDFSMVPPDRLEAAQIRGHEVHRLTALYAQGLWIDYVAPEYELRFLSVRKWFDKYVVGVHLVEVQLVDEDLKFKGTPDLILSLKREEGKVLPDLKTPMVGRPTWRLQCSSYRHLAIKAGHDIRRTFALRPRPDGKMPTIPPDYEYTGTEARDFAIFLSALNCWRYFNAS